MPPGERPTSGNFKKSSSNRGNVRGTAGSEGNGSSVISVDSDS